MAALAIDGVLDHHANYGLVQALAEYRIEFEHNASFGLFKTERDAMLAAAEYYEVPKPGSHYVALAFAPGLRNGFLYDSDFTARAFMLMHRKLVRLMQPASTKAIGNGAMIDQ